MPPLLLLLLLLLLLPGQSSLHRTKPSIYTHIYKHINPFVRLPARSGTACGQTELDSTHIHIHINIYNSTCLCVAAEHVIVRDSHMVKLDPPVVDPVQAHLGALFLVFFYLFYFYFYF
jgi:hypothetical protein